MTRKEAREIAFAIVFESSFHSEGLDYILENAADGKDGAAVDQYHGRGQQNALAQKLIVAERDKDSIRRECYDKDQRVPSLP